MKKIINSITATKLFSEIIFLRDTYNSELNELARQNSISVCSVYVPLRATITELYDERSVRREKQKEKNRKL